MIFLVSANDNKTSQEVYNMMISESGIKEIFNDKISRLIKSNYSILIKKDDEKIGFINLVDENMDGFLFLDMGIKEQYRNKGYGKLAISKLLKLLDGIDEYIIGETKITNNSANNAVNDIGAFICEKNEFNYYVFPKSRLNELQNDPRYELLINHFGNVRTRK